jgi:hypothetical protein
MLVQACISNLQECLQFKVIGMTGPTLYPWPRALVAIADNIHAEVLFRMIKLLI